MQVKVKVNKTFALPGQGTFVEGTEVKLDVTRHPERPVVHPDRFDMLKARGYFEILPRRSGRLPVGKKGQAQRDEKETVEEE